MSAILLVPMGICLLVGFIAIGRLIIHTLQTPKMLYPKTLSRLRERMLTDPNGRYFYQRFSNWCSIAGSNLLPEGYILLSLLFSVSGFAIGLLSQNLVVAFSLFILLLLSPTLLLYARYTVRKNKKIAVFCVFVDLFSRHYSSRKNIVLAFREMIEDCPKELEAELILLNNTLTDGGSPTQAIEAFAERLNHDWAHDFATYIGSGLEGETEDIQSSLNRLTNEMFIQQDQREERRSEIYAIWISLVIVIVICILLIPYNQSLLPESYRLYFFTADGQALLSLSFTVWCLSILLAFIWGRRYG